MPAERDEAVNIAILFVCGAVAIWVAAILSIEVLRDKATFWETVLHVGTVLMMVAVIFRERFISPASQWIGAILKARTLFPGAKEPPPDSAGGTKP